MNLIALEQISKVYTERKLFDKADFFLQEGEKVGVIGINGTGKSTLLRILAGLEEPDCGKVTRAGHIVIRFLPQHPEVIPGQNVIQTVLKDHGEQAADPAFEAQAKSMLTRLGVSDFEEPVEQLSGGQKKRLALVSALLTKADVLVLDEPTNHLDHDMSDWLEETLKTYRGTLVMVTHDRYFLDSVCSRIVEMDEGKIYSYDANYEGYLALKAERLEMASASERKRQSILRTELAWISRGARARTTKQKARIERYEQLKNQSSPEEQAALQLQSISSRMGKTTLEAKNLTKGYGGRTLIQDFTYIFLKQDRVGFIGVNGSGKSTLMKMLIGTLEPDSGEIITGQTIRIGYYAQEMDESVFADSNQRVIDVIRDVAENVRTPDGSVSASQMLERFLFPASMQYGPVGKLSGGEKRRLNLLRVLMGAPNVLVLDEPTNDLDIRTLTVLEDYLDHFDGIVITVSHDRYFLDRVVRRIFAFEPDGNLKQYEGGYTDYILRKQSENQQEAEKIPTGKVSGDTGNGTEKEKFRKNHEQKLKFTYQEQRDYETIEGEIAALEEKIDLLEKEMATVSTDFVKLNQIVTDKEAAEKLLEEKMDRWMYLEELAAKIAEQ